MYHVTLCIGQLHPIAVDRIVFVYALFCCWVSLFVPFAIPLIKLYYIIMTFIDILLTFFLFWTTHLDFL